MDINTQSIFISKPANSWIEEASLKPVPKMLFSEFWFSGELCVLYSTTNAGKSILAYQIGDSISKGKPIENFKLEAEKQKIIYFCLEMNAKQIENRYSQEYSNHYEFDDNFIRSEINLDSSNFLKAEKITSYIEEEAIFHKAKVIIIDNLTYLSHDNEKSNVALELMKNLKEIKSRNEFSILILSHTPKRDFNRPLSDNDLQGSKMLMNFFDSGFAIGKSYSDNSLRYLKQIKQRNCEQIYHEDNVCICYINKGKNDNFLQFEFLSHDTEYNHLNYDKLTAKENHIEEAKQLRQSGLKLQEIADRFEVTEGTVRYWLNKK